MKKAGELKPQVHIQALRSAIGGMFGGLLRGQLLAKRIDFPATYSLQEVRETFDLALSGFLVAGK
jgi:chorismate synthase